MTPTPRKELQLMERAVRAIDQMGWAGQEFVAAYVLNTTQDDIRSRGLVVRARLPLIQQDAGLAELR